MPRRVVHFDDEFFDSLAEQAPDERAADGTPSRSDLLAYVIMPLMDRLAEDYEANTVAVPAEFEWRVLIQTSPFVDRVMLWTYLDGDQVRVARVDLQFSGPTSESDDRSDG